ncbi:MAG: phenylacetate-CoA oxygenase subunit PaaC [Cyclobacteriaceae bacterium]|nr:phenylacetate-CoA oxygenase subunit PaaC [Cyclobacteriaceae bacterium]
MNEQALKDLLYKIADDQLIIGHRNSEWNGLGPILEEDIAFCSMAQDKIGQSLQFYKLLEELGEKDPDAIAFTRNAPSFHNSQLVELPIGDYEFSLMRHFLFDHAEFIRFEMLSRSSYPPLSEIAHKLKGEIKYHIMHANAWIQQLGNSTDEAVKRLQSALNMAFPYALGVFEESKFEGDLIQDGIFEGEHKLRSKWFEDIDKILAKTDLILPDLAAESAHLGGRYGEHTEHLQPLLDEMSEVFNIDPSAEW